MIRAGRGLPVALALAVITAMLLLAACSGNPGSGPGGDTRGGADGASDGTNPAEVKIGAVLYNSGPGSAYGQAQTMALRMAADEINAAGGINGTTIRLVIEDDKGNAESAIAAVQKLINSDQVLAIIGPTLSTNMFAAGPIADDAGVPIMGISTTAEGITDIGLYVFRNALPEEDVVPKTVAAAKDKLGLRRVSVLYGNDDDYTVSGYNAFRRALDRQGIEILSTQTFTTGQTNFAALLTKIKAEQPDALVISALYTEAANVVRQARQDGIDVPILGGNGFYSPLYIEIAGAAAENTLVGSPWFAGRDDPKARAFVQGYNELYGADPDQFAARAYDGLYLFAEAMAANPPHTLTDRDAFRDALAAIRNFEGAIGTFAFDENRNPHSPPAVLLVKDGQFVEFK